MRIAITEQTYAEERLVLGTGIPGVTYTYCPGKWHMRFKARNDRYYEFYKSAFQRVDGYHVFNMVMLTGKPWCANFETMMPRGRHTLDVHHHASFDIRPDSYTRFMLKAMARDNCKRLMALSECNLRLQHLLYDQYPDLAPSLKAKTCVAPVPQPLIAAEPRHKLNDRLRFCFVGRDFGRKGVPELVRALCRLRQKRRDFELVLVTQTANTYNYAFKHFQDSDDDIKAVLATIEAQKDWITLHPELPFAEVRELLLACDVGLLPTWAESYGYSTLEMEAAAMPCVTTNVRALPETNPTGWRVELPLNYAGEVALACKEQKEAVRASMESQLFDIFDALLDDRASVLSKGEEAWNFIRQEHSPERYSQFVADVYSQF